VDPGRGGVVLPSEIRTRSLGSTINGTVRGFWGFEPFVGPRFEFQIARQVKWALRPEERTALITGRQDTIHLRSENTCCVEDVSLEDQNHRELKTTWKAISQNDLEIKVALQDANPGPATISIRQFGLDTPGQVPLHLYWEASELDSFSINAGDQQGVLRGTRLDEVSSLELSGVQFTPAGLSRAEKKDELQLKTSNPAGSTLQPDENVTARVTLKDGRVLELPTRIAAPRPRVSLISKNIQEDGGNSTIHLGSQNDLPQGGRLSFVLKAEVPATFSRTEKIEVATADGAFELTLSVAEGSLLLQDSQTVLATLDPLKSFGPSAFGPVRFRPVDAQGRKGDWQPLVTLVRLPVLSQLRCPSDPNQPCTLTGTNLFLIDSVAADPQFTQQVQVPLGFMDSNLNVPRVSQGSAVYIRLRDDPAAVNTAVLPVVVAQQ
jgi:hypothetical protein